MTGSPEKLLLLSLRILKTAANQRISLDQKGLRIQKLNKMRMDFLAGQGNAESHPRPGDSARLALIKYLSKSSEKLIRGQI